MRTADICTRDVVTVMPETPLPQVARAMRRQQVGCVVVISSAQGVPVGIVTDRDIVLETVAAGLDASKLTAADVMSATVVTAAEDDDVGWSLKVMRDSGIRRLPVVDGRGRLVGILALDDVIREAADALADIVQAAGTECAAQACKCVA